MKRRQFLKTSTAAGIGLSALPIFGENTKNNQKLISFLNAKSSHRMLFPRPLDGITLGISPPGLAWYPAPGAAEYRVEIKNEAGSIVYEKNTGTDPVHLPDTILSPGHYTWDVLAVDEKGATAVRRGAQSFSISENPQELPWTDPKELLARVPKEHSRIIYRRDKLPEIKQRLSTTHQQIRNYIHQKADDLLDTPAPPFPTYHKTSTKSQSQMEYKRYFPVLRTYIDGALISLSQAYLFSGEKKYATAAKRILLEVTDWPTDYDDVTSVGAKWGDEPGLSLSRFAHKVYDWLYDALSDDEKERVFKMCEARAWQTYQRLKNHNYLTFPGESHDGRLIAYLAEMAVALAWESDGAETWLDYSLKALTTFYPHWGGIDGGWAEGIPYGLWYNNFYIPTFDTLAENTGYNVWKRPFFNRIRHFYIYCSSPLGEIRPFGDSAENGGPGTKDGSAFANLIHYHALRFKDPHAAWWVKQIKVWNGPTNPVTCLFENDVKAEAPSDAPDSKVFRGVGWAGLHSILSDPGNDTFMLFKSSPYGSVSHSHGDQNAFAIMKGGFALAIPSGYYGPKYGKPHHAEWTRSTKANNSVLVNGNGQVLRDDKAAGVINHFEDRKGYTYLIGDAAQAYGGQLTTFNRHVLFLRPGLFLMLDDLEAPNEATFQWMLHAFEKMDISDNRVVSTRKGARLNVWLNARQPLSVSQTDKFDTPYNEGIPEEFHREMPNHWHVTVETSEKVKKVRIGAIMAVDTLKDEMVVRLLKHPGWFGARAAGRFGHVEGWMQLKPGSPCPDAYSKESQNDKVMLCGTDVEKNLLLRPKLDLGRK